MRKFKWISAFSLASVLVSSTAIATSCSLFGLTEKLNNPIPKGDSNIPRSENSENSNEQPKKQKVTSFEYKGITYRINEEDNLSNIKTTYEMIMDETDLINAIIDPNEYDKVTNLNDHWFPTIARLSQIIRGLNVLDQDGYLLLNNEKNSVKITYNQYKRVVEMAKTIFDNRTSKLEEKLKSWKGKTNDLRESHGRDFVKNIYHKYEGNSRDEIYSKMYTYGKPSRQPYLDVYDPDNFIGTSAKEENHNFNTINSKRYRTPSVIWKLNRAFVGTGSITYPYKDRIDNEMFLSREFYEKTLDSENESLDVDWLDWLYATKTSALALQLPQFNLLKTYLDVLYTLTIAKFDENQKFKDNAQNNGLYYKLVDFESALLDYMKLENVLGITAKPTAAINLQLFPGGSNYRMYFTDFRDTYKWAYNQYMNFVYPLLAKLDSAINRAIKFNETFAKNRRDKYEMIWANIQTVDEIPPPRVLNENEINRKYDEVLNKLKNKFEIKVSG